MDYASTRETAAAWNVSERLVQRLCAEGRIPGARKVGGSWIVPEDAEKPGDQRKRTAVALHPENGTASESGDLGPDALENANGNRFERRPCPRTLDTDTPDPLPASAVPKRTDGAADEARIFGRLMPLLNTSFAPGTCQAAIESFDDPGMRAVARAEYFYFSGQAEEAVHAASELLSHDDLAVRLSSCLIYTYANLPLGNINSARFALAELRLALEANASSQSSEIRAAEAFVGSAASVLLHLPLPDNAPPVETFLPLLPVGLRSFALYVRAHQMYLQGDYAHSLGLVESALLMGATDYPIPQIYLRMVAVMDCMSLKQADDARRHLLAAWDLGRPDGLIEAFGEHHGLLGGMLESVIKKEWPEDFKRIIDITYRFSAGWRRIHNPATEETIADNLTTTEFAVSMLAARKWTNREIAAHLSVSESTVKGHLASAFRKLDIRKRRELGKFMLR
ncbi:MAG TPA: helix-turn-helix transcriptional regulator [Candidatus Aphodovivens avistercoris]|nr:helix-turn-helix transcriptional regulator [Candidatus Aphodovivens avistercoris]